jgi:cytochrome c oxidase subunit 4
MGHAHSDSHELGHNIGFNVHMAILLVLIVFTVITVWAAGIDFGNPNANIIVAMLIASVKATLVGMYFMHLRYENPLIWLFVSIPIVILFIMIGGLFLDNPTREVPGKSSYLISKADGVETKKKSH